MLRASLAAAPTHQSVAKKKRKGSGGMLPHRATSVAPSSLDFSDGSYLAALLTQVVASLAKYKDRGAIIDDTPEVHGLCFVLEKIFVHELKAGPRGNFWEFVERLQDSLPGNQAAGMLDKLRNWTRSNTGRGRAFLRLSLNQHTIVEYLQALVWNTGLLRSFYTRGAFFRNEHLVTEMLEQLEHVLPLQFSLSMHFTELDREDYWNAHRTEIQDLHIRVISGRENEFKFGLLSVEGDERRRREQVRKRTNSLNRENTTEPRVDAWENSEAERVGSGAVATRRDSLGPAWATPASTTPASSALSAAPKTSPERDIGRDTRAAVNAAREEAKRLEEAEKRRKEEENDRKRQEELAKEEEERRRRQEEEERQEMERKMKEEAERQRLEEEERTVLEEAKRLEEELAWRRKQREMARKKARGSERRKRQQQQQAANETVAEKSATEQSNDEQRTVDAATVVQATESAGSTREGTTDSDAKSGDSGKEDEGERSGRQQQAENKTESEDDKQIEKNDAVPSDREESIDVQVTGATETAREASEEEKETLEEEDTDKNSSVSALQQVEKMLRDLEERRMKLLQEVQSPQTEQGAPGTTTDAVKQNEPANIDSLLQGLDEAELDGIEEVLNFCEAIDDRPAGKVDPSSSPSATPTPPTTTTKAPAAEAGLSKKSQQWHLDEVLRFCDELDEELVGAEFGHAHEQRLRKLAAKSDNPAIHILSSSPGLPFLASSSFKREGVWASMHASAGDDTRRSVVPLHAPSGGGGDAAPSRSLVLSPGKREHITAKLSASPKKEMMVFHLQQKRAERERATGSPLHLQTATVEPLAIEKENPAKSFTRGRTGSLLSKGLETTADVSPPESSRNIVLSRSTPTTPTRDVDVVKPTVGPQKNFRHSYYSSLMLRSPSTPPTDLTAVQARNSELRRVRSIERERRQQAHPNKGGSPASVGNTRERTEMPPRRLDFKRDPALTASGRSVTINSLGSAAKSVVQKPSAVAAADDDVDYDVQRRPQPNRKRLSMGSVDDTSEAMNITTRQAHKAKLQRPIWARDSEHTNCGICEAAFSLVLRRIFCYKCCVKAAVPDLDYTTPVSVCHLCYSTLPPPPSAP